jgi:hypothetical protein
VGAPSKTANGQGSAITPLTASDKLDREESNLSQKEAGGAHASFLDNRNPGGHQPRSGRGVQAKLDTAAGATSAPNKPPTIEHRTQGRAKVVIKELEATTVQDGILCYKYANEDNKEGNDKAKDSGKKLNKEDDAKLDLLCQKMDALEHRMYPKETMAAIFACAVYQAWLDGQAFRAETVASLAAIFEGSNNPDLCVVTAALERDAAKARAYLVIMNDKVSFTLLHHLQWLDHEIRPGDSIATKIVAFEEDI